MKRNNILSILTLFLFISSLSFVGFDCGSPEMEGAKLAIQQKNFTRAQELIEKEVTTNPKNEDAWFVLGQVRIELNNLPKAFEAFDQANSIGSLHSSEIHTIKLRLWVKFLNEGATFSSLAQKGNKDSSDIYKHLALDRFQKAIVVNKDSSVTYRNLGIAYFSLNNRDSALLAWHKAMELDKSFSTAYDIAREHYNEAVQLRETGQSEKSKNEFTAAINVLNEAKVYTNTDAQLQSQSDDILLSSYLETGDTLIAMKSYSDAVTKDPNNKVYRLNYGILLMKAGKFSDAQNQFEEIVKIDPDWEEGNLAAGELQLKQGIKMRDEAIKKKNESNKKDAVIDTSYKPVVRKAVTYLERYTSKNPNNAGAWSNLGTAYVIIDGNEKRSKTAYEKADALKK